MKLINWNRWKATFSWFGSFLAVLHLEAPWVSVRDLSECNGGIVKDGADRKRWFKHLNIFKKRHMKCPIEMTCEFQASSSEVDSINLIHHWNQLLQSIRNQLISIGRNTVQCEVFSDFSIEIGKRRERSLLTKRPPMSGNLTQIGARWKLHSRRMEIRIETRRKQLEDFCDLGTAEDAGHQRWNLQLKALQDQ